MDEIESASKFDGLVSAGTLYFQSNSLTRVPSLKKCGSLTYISLAFNKITQILPGDFDGVKKLAILSLSGNEITSVAASAFHQLTAMRLTPDAFNIVNKNFTNTLGIGMCAARTTQCGAGLFWHRYWTADWRAHLQCDVQSCHESHASSFWHLSKSLLVVIDVGMRLHRWYGCSTRVIPWMMSKMYQRRVVRLRSGKPLYFVFLSATFCAHHSP